MFRPASAQWTQRMLGLFRIIVGLVFLTHGTAKLFGFPSGPDPIPTVALLSQRGLAGVLETFGGALIALGLFTRPVAFLLAGEMAVAYFQVHFPRSFFPTVNGGVSAVLYCFTFLYFTVAGPGEWSMDGLLGHHAEPRTAAPGKGVSSG